MQRLTLKICFFMEEIFSSHRSTSRGPWQHPAGGTLKPTIFPKNKEVIAISGEMMKSESTELVTPHWLKPQDSMAKQDLMCFQTVGFLGLEMKYFNFPHFYKSYLLNSTSLNSHIFSLTDKFLTEMILPGH